jgi:hypothetical protein
MAGYAPLCLCSFPRWGLFSEVSLLVVLFLRSMMLLVALVIRTPESLGELFTLEGGLPAP